jgi:pimeloyl-ACP methyl ester carboxylesterase
MKPRRNGAPEDRSSSVIAPADGEHSALQASKSTASPDRTIASRLPIDAHDLRGVGQLAVTAVTGITDLVEEMHRNIAALSPLLGRVEPGALGGISGTLYSGVRGITRLVGRGVDASLERVASLTGEAAPTATREATRAVLNGVLGDHLGASGNPLAVPMSIRVDGSAVALRRAELAAAWPQASARVVVLVHGLCMNDLQWRRDNHDHAAALARTLGCTPVHLHYNSGLRISANGQALASLIEQLAEEWPVPLESIDFIGHSMGGLLARSATHYGAQLQHRWPDRLRSLVFLGSPHHGAALERAGNFVDRLLGASPYVAPFARVGKLRSAGVRDLRHGNLLDEDWMGHESDLHHDTRTPVPLPAGLRCYAVAGSRSVQSGGQRHQPGDGLVSIDSALGRHPDPQLDLKFPESRTRVFERHNHFDLLGSAAVFEQLRDWLQ